MKICYKLCFQICMLMSVCLFVFITHCRVPDLTGYGVVLASDWMTGSTGRTGSQRF